MNVNVWIGTDVFSVKMPSPPRVGELVTVYKGHTQIIDGTVTHVGYELTELGVSAWVRAKPKPL